MTLHRRPAPLCILVLTTLLAGCGGAGAAGGTAPGSPGGGATTGATAATGTPAASTATATASDPAGVASGAGAPIDSLDALSAAVERDHGSADWFGDVTAITKETLLGAPVLVVQTTLSIADPDYEAVNRKRNDIGTAIAQYDQAIAPNIVILDADHYLWSVASGGMGSVPLDQAFALPERPATARAVRAWLDAVYGPAGLVALGPDEAWMGFLRDVRYEDPGWGTGKVLWLETSLPTYRTLDAKLLERALLTTGSPLLDNWYLDTKDNSGAAGGTPGAEDAPMGNGGFFYVP